MKRDYRKRVDGQARTKFELRIWSHYRLTLEEYDELMSNGCFVCGSTKNLCIDHDHSCCPRVLNGRPTQRTCGKCIRGVLCRRHNLAEGHLNSDPQEVRRLLEYLEK